MRACKANRKPHKRVYGGYGPDAKRPRRRESRRTICPDCGAPLAPGKFFCKCQIER